MRLLIYLAIAVVAAYLGYKLAEITIANKQIKSNIQPIVDELKTQLSAIQTSITNSTTPEEKASLQAKKDTIINLLAKFYGYTTDQLNAIINNKTA